MSSDATHRDIEPTTALAEACRRACIEGSGAQLIRSAENVLFRLPSNIVARVGRVGQDEAARKEVAVADWLHDNGVNAVRTIPGVAQPVIVNGRPVTFWRELPPHHYGTPVQVAAVLRQLHRLPTPTGFALPPLQPFVRLAERINAATTVSEADRGWMRDHLAELQQRYHELSAGLPVCVIHGDAWVGNIVSADDGTAILLDLERCSIGPPEWDLVHMADEHFSFGWLSAVDYAAYCRTYGHDVHDWAGFDTLRDIREFRQTLYACQTAAYDPAHQAQAGHRLACIRGRRGPRPWPGWLSVG